MQRLGETKKDDIKEKVCRQKKKMNKKMNQSSNSAHSGIFMTVPLDAVSRSLSLSLRVKIVRATEERRRLVTFDVQGKKIQHPPPTRQSIKTCLNAFICLYSINAGLQLKGLPEEIRSG